MKTIDFGRMHYCISETKQEYIKSIRGYEDTGLIAVTKGPSFRNVLSFNTQEWRMWRRLVWQEIHKRGLVA